MRSVLLLALVLLSIAGISASCDSGQIDINTASAEELDQLYGIGPAKAQAIISIRPFVSVDDLINVNGIGNATLNGIKAQGLACVKNERTESDSNDEENSKDEEVDDNKTISNNITFNINTSPIDNYQPPKIEIINLNPPANDTKDIKTDENSEFPKDKIAMYGFFAFSILIGILLIIRRRKIYKNDI